MMRHPNCRPAKTAEPEWEWSDDRHRLPPALLYFDMAGELKTLDAMTGAALRGAQ
jgi:hypothetical protein